MKRMRLNAEIEYLADQFLNSMDSGIAEFEDLFAIGTDQVIVLTIAKRRLVFGLVLTELMPDNQIRLLK